MTDKEKEKINFKEVERIKTGIEGFDNLVDGGIPQNFNVLVSGGAGTGKTIFGLSFIYNGAIKYKEKGLFLSFEQSEESLKKQAYQLGMDFEKAEVTIEYINPHKVGSIAEIVEIIKKFLVLF